MLSKKKQQISPQSSSSPCIQRGDTGASSSTSSTTSNMCRIRVQSDGHFYQVGDVVHGLVYLYFSQPMPRLSSRGVTIKLIGMEEVSWEDAGSDSKVIHSETQHVKPPRQEGGALAAGQYQLPFSMELPSYLSATFLKERRRERFNTNRYVCSVEYKLWAYVDVSVDPNGPSVRISHIQPLVVHARAQPHHVTYALQEKMQHVRLLGVLPRGEVAMNIHVDKNAYHIGDEVYVRLEVNNMSKSSLGRVVVQVVRQLRLKKRAKSFLSNERKLRLDTIIASQELGGLQRGEAWEGKQAQSATLFLPKYISDPHVLVQEDVQGELVSCSYKVQALAYASSLAPKLKVEVPIRVFRRPFKGADASLSPTSTTTTTTTTTITPFSSSASAQTPPLSSSATTLSFSSSNNSLQ